MFERVILHATVGELKGQDFVLENETDCILGRSRECSHRLPDTFSLVSRRHCRIRVSAPFVRIQDLGSLNGTYVNGVNIGQRGKKQASEAGPPAEAAEYFLENGDELRIGLHAFRVKLVPSTPWAEAKARDPEQLGSGCCPVCN